MENFCKQQAGKIQRALRNSYLDKVGLSDNGFEIHTDQNFLRPREKETGEPADLAQPLLICWDYVPSNGGLKTCLKWKIQRLIFSRCSEYLFGYSEGRHKFIFNAASNESELYDLENDPHDWMYRVNLVNKIHDVVYSISHFEIFAN